MLKLAKLEFTEGKNRGQALVVSDHKEPNAAYEELRGADARQLAILEAAKAGMPDPRINDSVSVIAIDENGDVVKNPLQQKQVGFGAVIPLIRKMV